MSDYENMSSPPSSQESASGPAADPATRKGSEKDESAARRKKIIGVVAAGVALVVIAALVFPRFFSSEEEAVSQNVTDDRVTRVSGYIVQPQVISDRIFTTGALRANEEVELVSETSGRITQILFGEGTQVQRGQMLLTINDAELQAELERLQFELELAEQRAERQRQLLDRGGISQQEFEDVENQVNVLRSEERLLRARIDKSRVRAPFSGRIGLRHVSEGSYLSQQDRIATLRSINPIKIDFSIPERYAGRVEAGDEISFRVEGIDGTLRGEVYAIEPGISAASRALQLRAESANPDARLLPGLFANIELELDQVVDALVVPAVAVLAEQQGSQVYVVENGQVATRTVQTGIRTDSTVQITYGVNARDTVLTGGFQQLRPGDRVEVEGLDDLPREEELEDLPDPQEGDAPATTVSGN